MKCLGISIDFENPNQNILNFLLLSYKFRTSSYWQDLLHLLDCYKFGLLQQIEPLRQTSSGQWICFSVIVPTHDCQPDIGALCIVFIHSGSMFHADNSTGA